MALQGFRAVAKSVLGFECVTVSVVRMIVEVEIICPACQKTDI